jgi:hypothetical protein
MQTHNAAGSRIAEILMLDAIHFNLRFSHSVRSEARKKAVDPMCAEGRRATAYLNRMLREVGERDEVAAGVMRRRRRSVKNAG